MLYRRQTARVFPEREFCSKREPARIVHGLIAIAHARRIYLLIRAFASVGRSRTPIVRAAKSIRPLPACVAYLMNVGDPHLLDALYARHDALRVRSVCVVCAIRMLCMRDVMHCMCCLYCMRDIMNLYVRSVDVLCPK